jgi:large subunit ribosomal protein L13
MNTTVRMKASQLTKDWRVVDAAGRPLGRVATEVAALLRGKHKPTFEPHLDGGDFVIVINASQVRVTGRKSGQITYYRHSGYPGGLKARSYEEQLARYPERVIEQAVKGMLPSGTLGEAMFKHLKVYKGPNHPHQSQVIGTERAQAARRAAADAALGEPMKAKHLPPLRGRVDTGETPLEPEAIVEAAILAEPVPTEAADDVAEEAPKPRARRRKAEQPEAAAEAPAVATVTESEPDTTEPTPTPAADKAEDEE